MSSLMYECGKRVLDGSHDKKSKNDIKRGCKPWVKENQGRGNSIKTCQGNHIDEVLLAGKRL